MKLREVVQLNEFIEKRGSEWVVLNHTKKKVLGRHDSREKALKQLQAIEINKHNN